LRVPHLPRRSAKGAAQARGHHRQRRHAARRDGRVAVLEALPQRRERAAEGNVRRPGAGRCEAREEAGVARRAGPRARGAAVVVLVLVLVGGVRARGRAVLRAHVGRRPGADNGAGARARPAAALNGCDERVDGRDLVAPLDGAAVAALGVAAEAELGLRWVGSGAKGGAKDGTSAQWVGAAGARHTEAPQMNEEEGRRGAGRGEARSGRARVCVALTSSLSASTARTTASA